MQVTVISHTLAWEQALIETARQKMQVNKDALFNKNCQYLRCELPILTDVIFFDRNSIRPADFGCFHGVYHVCGFTLNTTPCYDD